ncbi:MBL fold metallo-hydrolase [Comamonas aquatica]|uniref:MBL fold metallo-hydrolase n=1 Tax=Comamonas aquatica TaxID=225991 RepID=A0AA42W1R7_9BURK|nr:MBL fold metallo-hydrolase [Comamonas aquatica]MDH0900153.1 MBL fold metallo-hydrolase [Comamonas aquatica]MDH1428374.1 MBL fold metallo-hydrolase [Comamonas aquatica]MDH1605227.1 MBL fold metallo-hydrolase [Comamonas aquatica]MDH1617339.1 MBL fold metallo-hydrolase [Comamonas aquatica]MDH2005070.1 MBL fold metallo-hydrolase [Comamonas aquatica]
MQITFHGAAQQVTGSCFLVEAADCRFLIDCGMVQGNREARERNYEPFAFDPRRIDFVLLSHAHIDHSGMLPRLAMQGFSGPIFTTPATLDLVDVLLKDSAHIQETDFERSTQRASKPNGRHRHHKIMPPLYTLRDVNHCLRLFHTVDYDTEFAPHASVKVRFRDAGHILGSAILEVWLTDEQGRTRKLVASGDLGQPGRPILRDPTPIDSADVLLIESTYGDRLHKDMPSTLDELVEVVQRTVAKGNVVIPAFAVGRTQELIYEFLKLSSQGQLWPLDIFIDSPMAIAATEVTRKHFTLFDDEARELFAQAKQLTQQLRIHFVSDVQDSIKLTRVRSGAVIISASGMCDAGRVIHHLHQNLGRRECAVVIAGFQAQGTLGRRLVDGERHVRLLGDDIEVQASIHTLGGFSAHADQRALLDWARAFERPPTKAYVIHGEAQASQALASALRQQQGWGTSEVVVPSHGSAYAL